ncbi:MAG: glycosyltransferase [Thermodesulfobacteriota bacterium]
MKKGKEKHKRNMKEKVKTANNLSIVIIGKDKEEFLEECIDACLKLSSSIVYLDLESMDGSVATAEKKGVKTAKRGQSLDNLCTSQWILFLRPDERPAPRPDLRLDNICSQNSVKGYSLLIERNIEPEVLDAFQWLKMNEQYRDMGEAANISTIEARLVHRDHFAKFVKFMMSQSKEDIFSFSSKMLPGLRVLPCRRRATRKEKEDHLRDIDIQIKYLKGEISCSPKKDEGMPELGDEYIIFSVLTKKDVGRYYKGLAMGFGSERMYMTLLHYLGQFGRFQEARDFFEAWQKKWGFFDTSNPFKIAGILYANLFDIDRAVFCFEKYRTSCSDENLKEILSLLGKVYLLQGKKGEALSCLKRALESDYDKFNDIIVQAVDCDEWKPATLSVCMIARDEATTIGRALESVFGIADEIIVVNTGSTDDTKEIIRKFNAKVIDIPWENDFSKARNIGLREAKCDYILCLDADEFIDPRDRIKLALTKQILPVKQDIAFHVSVEEEDEDEETAVMLRLPKINKPGYPVRLFPAREAICFEGRVFESVEASLAKEGISIKPNEIFKITHSKSDRKFRNQRKEAAVRNTYDSISDPETALRGALFFLKIDQPQEALVWLQKAELENPLIVAKIISLYSMIGKTENLGNIIDNTLEQFPDSMEMILAKAELSFVEREYENVCKILRNRMEAIKSTMEREGIAKACYLLGMALMETGDHEEGVQYLIEAREEDTWNSRYKIGGIYALVKGGEFEGAIGAVADIMRDENIDLSMTINDFADMGILFSKLGRHFISENRAEAASLCGRIVDYIIENNMTKKSEIEKMAHFLNTSNESVEVSADA